jgi:CheY-like chemotaxis protein
MKRNIFGKSKARDQSADQPLIVMVDDEPDPCKLMELALRPRGYAFAMAHDGRSGLELIRERQPALVLLDIRMPIMNGYQLLALLQQDPKFARIPVFVMTSMDSERQFSDEEWAGRLGIARYVSKPFDAEAVALLIDQTLRPPTTDADPSA